MRSIGIESNHIMFYSFLIFLMRPDIIINYSFNFITNFFFSFKNQLIIWIISINL